MDLNYTKKITAILVILFIPIVFVICIFTYLVFFPDKPATEEKISEVLDLEFKNEMALERSYADAIELVDFLDKHKNEILDSLKKREDESDCLYLLPNKTILPNHLAKEFNSILSKQIYRDLRIQVCGNGKITLWLFKRTDYKNFLYIEHLFYIGDSKGENTCTTCREKIIRGKYHFAVIITDAFNDIDPNNIAPN